MTALAALSWTPAQLTLGSGRILGAGALRALHKFRRQEILLGDVEGGFASSYAISPTLLRQHYRLQLEEGQGGEPLTHIINAGITPRVLQCSGLSSTYS